MFIKKCRCLKWESIKQDGPRDDETDGRMNEERIEGNNDEGSGIERSRQERKRD